MPKTKRRRKTIESVTRRRMKHDVRERIREFQRAKAAEPQPTYVPKPVPIEDEFPETVLGATTDVPEAFGVDLSTLTRDGLRAEAKARGLSGYGSLTKQGLLNLLGASA